MHQIRYQLVHETSQVLYREMIEQEGWANKQEVNIAHLNQHMIKVSQGFFVKLHLLKVVPVLSVDPGSLCVWDASVMDFRRHK